jgi:transcriptional regulator with XRE-family HTH domain
MSTKSSTKVIPTTFVERFIELFGTNEPAEVQRKLGINYQSALNYLGGRKPKAEVLEKIVEKTNVSLNWLLMGQGPKFAPDDSVFDLDRSLERHEDWRPVLDEWFSFEGRKLPDDFLGANLMAGWKRFEGPQKKAALTDLKKLLDISLKDEANEKL